jgi:hypothetical protein
MTPRERAEAAAREILDYHGCASGDCPHDKQAQCFEALVIAGYLTCAADREGRVAMLEKQLGVAIECLDKYRTLVISKKEGTMPFRLGVPAEDALNLMAAIRRKALEQGERQEGGEP